MEISKPEPGKNIEMGMEVLSDRYYDSDGLECVAALVENLEVLDVQENILTRPHLKELIQKLIEDFTEYDTTFLKEYLDVLQNNNHLAMKEVTNNIVYSIELVIKHHICKQQLTSDGQWQEPALVVLLGWMCAIMLCLTDPHVKSPYCALNELLLHTTKRMRVRLASAFWRHLRPAQVIELADVTTGIGDQSRSEKSADPEEPLADLLLRAALTGLQPERLEPQWNDGPLNVEEVGAGLRSAWSAADADERLLLVQVAARTHAVRELLAVARAAHHVPRSATDKVSVEMSKFNLLFVDDENVKNRITTKSHKRVKKE